MKIAWTLILLAICLVPDGDAQGVSSSSSSATASTTPPSAAAVSPEAKVAQAALEAHGGTKLKAMKTLVLRGSVDITTSAINQAIPATFSIAISGEKYLIDIQNPFQPLKQVFDGKDTRSSIAGFSLPPVTSLGFPLLPKIGEAGYLIMPLPETAKKKKGFRMTTPDGFYTDFYLDEKRTS